MSTEREHRLQDILERLRMYPQGFGVSHLANLYHTNRTTIFRDLITLQKRGIALERVGNKWRLDERTSVVFPAFTIYEVASLYLALRLLARNSDECNPHIASVLSKVADALSDSYSDLASFIRQTATEIAERPRSDQFIAMFETIVQGWFLRRKVQIRYRSAKGDTTERIFSPHFLEPGGNGLAWYAIGWDDKQHAVRTFKLERILTATLTVDPFAEDNQIEPTLLFRSAWGVMWGEGDISVQLRFVPAVVWRIQESRWHHTQQFEVDGDGYGRFQVHIAHQVEIVPWIREWGGQVEVLAPESLRQQFIEETRQLASQYLR